MRILFASSNTSISTGSYRIWVRDLSHYFKKIGVQSEINSDDKGADVVILGKGDQSKVDWYRNEMPKAKIGLINPPSNQKYKSDFIIVGSVEEMDSLSVNDNVFIFPLIERTFENQKLKEHSIVNPLTIGFHGHYPHLFKLNPHFKPALEEFSKERDIKLKIVTGQQSFSWDKAKPDIQKVEIVPWDIDTVVSEIKSCDIGIIPNITCLDNYRPILSVDEGLYDTDYMIRFKNKSNAGRAFVFIQLGIPVIADITPSNLHLFGNPDCGYAVLSKEGCLKGLRELSDPLIRSKMAQEAIKEFNRLYDPLEWAERLRRQIKALI